MANVRRVFHFMGRRSTPQSKIDDLAFPVRLKLTIPDIGLGRVLDDIDIWLRSEVGIGEFARHSQRGLTGGSLAIYFRSADHAACFAEVFAHLALADGTASPVYSSPHRGTNGRYRQT